MNQLKKGNVGIQQTGDITYHVTSKYTFHSKQDLSDLRDLLNEVLGDGSDCDVYSETGGHFYAGNVTQCCGKLDTETPKPQEEKVCMAFGGHGKYTGNDCPKCERMVQVMSEPPKEPSKQYEEIMLAAGYIKTPTGWISHGEATPAQMTYHLDWMKNRKEPSKKPRIMFYDNLIIETSRRNPMSDNDRRVCDIEALVRTLDELHDKGRI